MRAMKSGDGHTRLFSCHSPQYQMFQRYDCLLLKWEPSTSALLLRRKTTTLTQCGWWVPLVWSSHAMLKVTQRLFQQPIAVPAPIAFQLFTQLTRGHRMCWQTLCCQTEGFQMSVSTIQDPFLISDKVNALFPLWKELFSRECVDS